MSFSVEMMRFVTNSWPLLAIVRAIGGQQIIYAPKFREIGKYLLFIWIVWYNKIYSSNNPLQTSAGRQNPSSKAEFCISILQS